MRMSQSGPPGPASAARWRRWLFPSAIAAGIAALLVLPRRAAPYRKPDSSTNRFSR